MLGTQDFDKNHFKLLISSLEFKPLLEFAADLQYLDNCLSFEIIPVVLVQFFLK